MRRAGAGGIDWRTGRIDPVAGAYLAVALLALGQAAALGSPGRTAQGAVPYLVAGIVVAAVGARPVTSPDRGVRIVAAAGVGLGAWALARFLWAVPDGIGAPHGFYRVKGQVTSVVGDHNTLAGLLLVGLVAAASLTGRDRRWLAAVAVGCLGVAACLSRGAAVVLVAVAAASTVLASHRTVRWTLGVSAVATLLAVGGLAVLLDASPPPGSPAAPGAVGASVVARADLALRGLEVAGDRPLIGAGLGSFGEVAADLPAPNGHAHQLLAHAAAEGGVVLLAVAVAVPLVMLGRAWRAPPSPLRDTALLGGGGLVAHAQVEALAGRIGYEVVLAVLVALTGAVAARARAGVSDAGAAGA